MSIDKLISELSKESIDIEKVIDYSKRTQSDYISVSKAYFDLMVRFQSDVKKMGLLCKIIQELISSIEGINNLIESLNAKKLDGEGLGALAGMVLKGEETINSLVEQFEEVN
ncbi:MAG: hypothetical protein ACD_79C00739G0022 [uncultured bacterium]|nr:MAG: hypothetical protein ACD_79C00739G0022 [uncultured bacterium]